MATGGQKQIGYNLVNVGTLTLQTADLDPRGIIVSREMLMITDFNTHKVHVYRRHDGMLLSTSDQLEADPNGMCFINDREICVALRNGKIEFMSVDNTGQINRGKQFNLQTTFNECHGVGRFRDKVVVCGVINTTICWCIASLEDGHVDDVHNICEGWLSFLTIKDTMIYILCYTDSHDSCCVYGCNIMNPRQQPFVYKHEGLWYPRGITVDDKGFLFVCDFNNQSIHHLTNQCQIVTKYMEGIPRNPTAIFWDNGILYVASMGSNVIHRYKLLYPHQQGVVIPAEVLNMDTRSLEMYKKALRDGKEKVYNIRVMVVGQYGVGKTTLTKRLLGKDVKISDRQSTEGIDIHIDCCKVSLATGEWILQEKTAVEYSRLQRLVKLLSVQKLETSEKHRPDTNVTQVQSEKPVRKSNLPPSRKQTPSAIVKVDKRPSVKHSDQKTRPFNFQMSEAEYSESEKKKDTVMEILQLVNKNVEKLEKSIMEYATLAMWDFAGQYAFYTTHQTFLTSRAIYLLVIDLNQQVTDLIKNDQYFHDTEGIKRCKVHDLIEIWLNSIHSCAPSTAADIPPVILVGTHVDKIPKKSRQKVIDEYFLKIRYMLNEKPTVLHLMDDIAIDNTQCDPRLEELKRKIFELASKQPHWGEEKPARWLPLEQAMMTLKASGAKVVLLSLVEEINRSGSVMIEDRDELDLFLRFHHEIGTILYFSVEELREKIVLDPQWLIDALKSLITAEEFIRKNPVIIQKWCEFKGKGKLTHELIDGIWTKEKNPEFHENKKHILLLMEKLNIIARPRSYIEDGKETKVENYFLAPCMLKETTPKEVIAPKPHRDMESSSVLSYVFKEKFLPAPIFHRLLAACVAKWPIAKSKKSENLIYCGCCVFDLDLHHRLMVFFREYIIFAQVTRMGTTEKTPALKECIEVREFITMTLSKIIGYLGQSLQFELFIRCPKSDGYGVDCLIPVADLQRNEDVPCHFHVKKTSHMIISHEVLKFWFQEKASQGKDEGNTVFCLPHNPQDHKLTERQLGRLSMKIGHASFRLGIELGLSGVDIEIIQKDYPHAITQCLKILVKWKQQSGDEATFGNLEKAFRNVEIDVDIFSSIDKAGDMVSCLPPTMLDKQPDDRHLNRISCRIGTGYIHLGVELEVPMSRIDQILTGHPGDVHRQCFEIMKEWRQRQARQATFRNLEHAFKCVGIDPSILKQSVN